MHVDDKPATLPDAACASREALREAVAARLRELPTGSVPYLIVPSVLEETEWRRWFADNYPGLAFGLEIASLPTLVVSRWDFIGDGRTILNNTQRTLFMADALEAHARADLDRMLMLGFGEDPEQAAAEVCASSLPVTYGMTTTLASVVSEMYLHAAFRDALAGVDLHANPAFDVIARYDELIREHGLVEYGEALQHLAENERPNVVTIWVEKDHMLPAEKAYCVRTSGHVFTLDPAGTSSAPGLSELIDHIYHPGEPLEPTQAVRFASASGIYAEPPLVAQLVEEYVNAGIAPEDIVVSSSAPSKLMDVVAPKLSEKGIPVSGTHDTVFARTLLGRVHTALREAVLDSIEERDGAVFDEGTRLRHIARITDVALSPLSPINADAARKLDREMRGNRTLPLSYQLDALGLEDTIALLRAGDEASAFALLAQRAFSVTQNDELERRITEAAAREGSSFLEQARSHKISNRKLFYELIGNVTVRVNYGVAGQKPGEDLEAGPGTFDGGAVRFLTMDQLARTTCRVAIICQLTAEDYPLSMRADPPAALFRLAGLPREDTYLEDRRITFKRALAAAADAVVLERSLNDKDATPLRPSVLFEEAVDCYRPNLTTTDDLDEVTLLPKSFDGQTFMIPETGAQLDLCVSYGENELSALFPTLHVLGNKPVEPASVKPLRPDEVKMLVAHGKEPVFSASQIELYLSCPYSWFVSRKIKPEILDATNDQRVLGMLAHASLKGFYDELRAQGLQRVDQDNLDGCRALFDMTFARQVELAQRDEDMPLVISDPLQLREIQSFGTTVRDLIADDAEFLPLFTPTYFEHEFGYDDTLVEYAGHRFCGAVDRIDVDKHGHAVIVDYKGGLSTSYTPKVDDKTGGLVIPHIQTLIYAQIARRYLGLDVVGAVYRSYKKRMVAGTVDGLIVTSGQVLNGSVLSVAAADALAGTFNDLLDRVEDYVASALDRLLAGDITPEPSYEESCKYCPAATAFCPWWQASGVQTDESGASAGGDE